jgi:hypothetical protein
MIVERLTSHNLTAPEASLNIHSWALQAQELARDVIAAASDELISHPEKNLVEACAYELVRRKIQVVKKNVTRKVKKEAGLPQINQGGSLNKGSTLAETQLQNVALINNNHKPSDADSNSETLHTPQKRTSSTASSKTIQKRQKLSRPNAQIPTLATSSRLAPVIVGCVPFKYSTIEVERPSNPACSDARSTRVSKRLASHLWENKW